MAAASAEGAVGESKDSYIWSFCKKVCAWIIHEAPIEMALLWIERYGRQNLSTEQVVQVRKLLKGCQDIVTNDPVVAEYRLRSIAILVAAPDKIEETVTLLKRGLSVVNQLHDSLETTSENKEAGCPATAVASAAAADAEEDQRNALLQLGISVPHLEQIPHKFHAALLSTLLETPKPKCSITLEDILNENQNNNVVLVRDVCCIFQSKANVAGAANYWVFYYNKQALSDWFQQSGSTLNPANRAHVDVSRDYYVLS